MINSFHDYRRLATQSICQATLVYDLGRSAEKMMNPGYLGANNSAWKEGPFLAAPTNMPLPNRNHLYILTISLESKVASNITLTGDYTKNPDREEYPNYPVPECDGSRVNPYVAKAVIIEQFEILKVFLISINAPINKKQCDKYAGIIEEEHLITFLKLVVRRNELTHDINAKQPNMKEAVEYFNYCLQISEQYKEYADKGMF